MLVDVAWRVSCDAAVVAFAVNCSSNVSRDGNRVWKNMGRRCKYSPTVAGGVDRAGVGAINCGIDASRIRVPLLRWVTSAKSRFCVPVLISWL